MRSLLELLTSWFGRNYEINQQPHPRPVAIAPEPKPRLYELAPLKRKVKRVFVHCSASDNAEHDDIQVIKRWHTDPKPRGKAWKDVGYHFFIKKDGTIQEGRPINITPAAQYRHNRGTIAICLHGLRKDKFTDEQFTSLQVLCDAILRKLPNVTFHGHKEVAAKSCPVFDYKSVLGLNSFGRIVKPDQ